MKVKNIVCKSILFLTLSLFSAQATTLYVSTSGSDSNPGTSSQPFRTITYAYSLAGPGTTIMVAPGTYTDYQSGWGLHLGSSGTASSPIVLQSQIRGGAIIDGQNASDRNVGIYIDGSYNIVDGFEIENGPNGGLTIWGNGNEILNNEIDHNGNPASTSTDGRDGLYEDENLSDNIYAGNYIHDNGRSNGSNLDHGMYLCGQNDLVFNNVSIRNDGSGLQIAGYTSVSNMKVYNNVFAWNGTEGIIVWQTMSGVDIENNISYQNTLYGIYFYAATGSGVVMDHNLVYSNGSGNYSSFSNGGSTVTYTMGTTIASDPMFANETSSGFDAHLSAGSPAIGAGLNFYSTFTTDLTGAARPSSGAWVLGAYVYASTNINITPPTVSMAAPLNEATVSGSSVTVSANASASAGIASVQFKLDGANLGSAFTSAPFGGAWDSTTAANGSHTLTAVATDTAGNQATATAVTITVSNTVSTLSLPTVGVTATANAARVGLTSGKFILTRSGSTAASLTVNYSLTGTAAAGTDYSTVGTTAIIPAGASSATITVAPLPSANYVGAESVVLTVSASSAYSVGSVNNATVTITGNSVSSSLSRSGGGMKITWNSVPGKVYRVADKNNLSATTWTDLSGLITATGTTTSYTDTTVSRHTNHYYVVFVTD